MINKLIKKKLENLPKTSGVYFFYDKNRKLIYIGKASVLKHRVKSYFVGPHDAKTEKLISQINDIKWRATSSIIEALILESNLIKKYLPKYNIREKDDKTFIQIALTDENYSRLMVYRPTEKKKIDYRIKKLYGPYTNASAVREILAIFRRVFTYRDCSAYKFARYLKKQTPCLYYPIGLCPAPCVNLISKTEYLKIIRQMTDFLEGKNKRVISSMKKQMKEFAKNEDYEKALVIRNRIYAFEHINDIAAIKNERSLEQIKNIPQRIEAYDISNLGKDFAVGSMVVFTGGEIDKDQYRKFRIQNPESKILEQNDTEMMAQVVERRFRHIGWAKPDLMLLDGGKGQLSAVLNILRTLKIKLPVIALAKGPSRKGFTLHKNTQAKKIILDRKFLESIRDEAHRFAISYHRKLRDKFSI